MGFKIVVDYQLCEANRVCVHHAPEVFQVDESDQLEVLNERPSDELRAKVQNAVRRCPRQALRLVDE